MKIHHTNRTMNATFNLKRFLLLEQYKRNETGRHLLWSAAVVSFICILCILYDYFAASHLIDIECMYRLTVFQHYEIGYIDDIVYRSHACIHESFLQPPR